MACVVAAVRSERRLSGPVARGRSRTVQAPSAQAQHREPLVSTFVCESRLVNLTLSRLCDHVVSVSATTLTLYGLSFSVSNAPTS